MRSSGFPVLVSLPLKYSAVARASGEVLEYRGNSILIASLIASAPIPEEPLITELVDPLN